MNVRRRFLGWVPAVMLRSSFAARGTSVGAVHPAELEVTAATTKAAAASTASTTKATAASATKTAST